MRIACVFTCSSEHIQYIEQIVRQESGLDKEQVAVGVAYPGGVEQRVLARCLPSDYLDKIEAFADANSVRMIFYIKSGAKRAYKDVIANIIFAVERKAKGISSIDIENFSESS